MKAIIGAAILLLAQPAFAQDANEIWQGASIGMTEDQIRKINPDVRITESKYGRAIVSNKKQSLFGAEFDKVFSLNSGKVEKMTLNSANSGGSASDAVHDLPNPMQSFRMANEAMAIIYGAPVKEQDIKGSPFRLKKSIYRAPNGSVEVSLMNPGNMEFLTIQFNGAASQ